MSSNKESKSQSNGYSCILCFLKVLHSFIAFLQTMTCSYNLQDFPVMFSMKLEWRQKTDYQPSVVMYLEQEGGRDVARLTENAASAEEATGSS